MSKIIIPPKHLNGIKEISLLHEDDIGKIYEILRKVPKGIGHQKFLSFFNEGFEHDHSNEIAEAIFSFGGLITNPKVKYEQLAEDIANSFAEQEEEEVVEEQRFILQERLSYILLLCESLKTTFEAFKLVSQAVNIVDETDIQTDINLLYNDDEQNRFGVIFHKLMISFQEDDAYKMKYFSVDQDDLMKLKLQIDEALIREENIKIKNKDVINFIDITN